MYACVHTYIQACTPMYTFMHVFIYACMYTYMLICAFTHILNVYFTEHMSLLGSQYKSITYVDNTKNSLFYTQETLFSNKKYSCCLACDQGALSTLTLRSMSHKATKKVCKLAC